MTAPLDDEIAEIQRVNTALRQQLDEQSAERDAALAREAALAEVLDIINRSPGDPAPVFEAILDKAHKLCGAAVGNLVIYEGGSFHALASHGFPEHVAAIFREPFPAGIYQQRLLRGERFTHVADLRALEKGQDRKIYRALRDGTDVLSFVLVPLRKDGALLGFISANWREARLSVETEVALLESFAAQAVIAIENTRLLGELRQRTDELSTRNSEYSERIEQQAATIDVLKAMSASPGDPQPVFDLILRRAFELCNAPAGGLLEFDGELVHLRSFADIGGLFKPELYEAYERLFPMVPTRESIACRTILDRQIIHVRDIRSEPGVMSLLRDIGYRSQICLPLLRDNVALGAIVLVAREPGGFTDSQIALLQTFAEQAVIAITSAETYRALQVRTTELQQSLEHQTATSEVLKVISRSSFDLCSRSWLTRPPGFAGPIRL